MNRFQRWRWSRKRYNCGVCGRVRLKGEACGTRKGERQRFPDGGFFSWNSWTPCSEYAPGGVHPPKPLLDECGDLDEPDAKGYLGTVTVS